MLTDQDYERLSAYVDGELSKAERTALETRLDADAELRTELEAIRATIGLLAALPARKAPRNFTLDARTARRAAPRVLFLPAAAFSALSAAAATVLIALSALLYSGAQVAPLASSIALAPTQADAFQREAQATLSSTPLSTEKQSTTASPAQPEESAVMDAAGSAPSVENADQSADNLPAAAPIQESESTVMQFAAPNTTADANLAASGMSAAASAPMLEQAAATPVALSTATPAPTLAPPTATPAPMPASVPQPDNSLPALLLIIGLALLVASITVGVRMGTRWR
jgi:anti-sigma factor RsiW